MIQIYLPIGTDIQPKIIDDLLDSVLSFFRGHVRWQTEESRKGQVLTNSQ